MSVRSDADTDRLTCSDSPPDPTTTGITITGWAYLVVDRNDFSTLCRVHGGAVPGTSTALNVATASDGTTLSLFTPSGSLTGTAMTVGAWSRWAATMQGTAGVIYRADAEGATGSSSGAVGTAVTPTGVTLFGRSAADATEWANARLAYVRVWSGVRNQAAIEAEWASSTPVVTANLWADWPLASHTDLTDHSGNGHHLVAGSTSTSTEADPPLTDTIVGTMAGSWAGTTGAMLGHRVVYGSLSGSWAGSAGVLRQGSSSAAATSGGWDTLLAISREARAYAAEEASRTPVACPNDGEPLRTGPDGQPFCIWDGWRPGP